LNLDASLLRAIEACGYTEPTEIQRRAVPDILAGKDVMASAQTGTGKTAAFVLPALQALLQPVDSASRGPRVLVLTPTRELAQQITDAIKELGRFVRLNFGAVVGGVPYGQQEALLRRPLDILIATPGRLMDHMAKGRVDFSRLQMLVLDEADRMLDMGFIEDVEHIAEKTPASRQTLLFSATLEGEIRRIAQMLLKEPVRIQVASVRERHDSIEQRVHHADDIKHKHALLDRLLSDTQLWQAIVFTATKRGADELADRLGEQGHQAAALHGDMKQSQRNRTVERLRRGKLRVLVATDVAARGLDIKGVTHVINFDLPKVAEDYVHRIGRTGRGGATGTAMSLVGPDDWMHLKRIERLIGQTLDRHVLEGLEPTRAEPRFERRPSSKGQPCHRNNGGQRPHHNRGRDFGNRADTHFSDRPKHESHRRHDRNDDGHRGQRPRFNKEGGNHHPRRNESRGERPFTPRFESRDDLRAKPRREFRPNQRQDVGGNRVERTETRPEFRNDRAQRPSESRPNRAARRAAMQFERREEPRNDFLGVPEKPARPAPRVEYKTASRPEQHAPRGERRPNGAKPRRDFSAQDGNAPLRRPRAEFIDEI
jgi:superfamily II DNA/RNA helicase